VNLSDYQEKIDWCGAKDSTCKAVHMALWLIIENDKPMSEAVKISCIKRDAKKSPVTKMIKEILPDGYLRKKAAARMPEGFKGAIRQVNIEARNSRRFKESI
jgi:hypothetical protein